MTERIERMTLSVQEAADELGVSAPIAYDLTHRADFPAFKIGNRTRVSREGLREWVRGQVQARLQAMQRQQEG